MPASLSIKDVPDELLDLLRQRAKRNHRSLQGELLAIIEEAVMPRRLTLDEVAERVGGLHLETGNESTDWVRELRHVR